MKALLYGYMIEKRCESDGVATGHVGIKCEVPF
jgi:hypothetical protein